MYLIENLNYFIFIYRHLKKILPRPCTWCLHTVVPLRGIIMRGYGVAFHHITLELKEEHGVEWHTIFCESFELSLKPNDKIQDLG